MNDVSIKGDTPATQNSEDALATMSARLQEQLQFQEQAAAIQDAFKKPQVVQQALLEAVKTLRA